MDTRFPQRAPITRELLGICTEFARTLSQGQDPEAALAPFLDKLNEALGAVGIAVWEPDPADGYMQITSYSGLPEAYVAAGNEESRTNEVNRAISPVYRTFDRQELAAYTGLMHPEHPFSSHARRIGGDSLYVVPLGREESHLGVVALYVPTDPTLTHEELLDWCPFVAQQVGLALYLKQLGREAASRDALADYRVERGISLKRELLDDLALLSGNLQMISEPGTLRDPKITRDTLAALRRTIKAYVELVNLVTLDSRYRSATLQVIDVRHLLAQAHTQAREAGAVGELLLMAAGDEDFLVQADSARLRAKFTALLSVLLPASPEGLRVQLGESPLGGVRLSILDPGDSQWESLSVPLRAVAEANGGGFGRFSEGGFWLDLPRGLHRLGA